jgi:uncharacterized protein YkwD
VSVKGRRDTGGRVEVRLSYRWFAVVVLPMLFASLISGESSVRAVRVYDQEELKFPEFINQYRQSKGFPALVLSDALAVSSKHHSEDIGDYTFSPTTPQRAPLWRPATRLETR